MPMSDDGGVPSHPGATQRVLAGHVVLAVALVDDIERDMAPGLDLTGWDVLDALARAGWLRMDLRGMDMVVRWERRDAPRDPDAGGSAPAAR
jgi:hypothetical protein